jgi:hypothetical protein
MGTDFWGRRSTLLDLGKEYGVEGVVLDRDENIHVAGGSVGNAGVHMVSNSGTFISSLARNFNLFRQLLDLRLKIMKDSCRTNFNQLLQENQ